MLTCDAQTISGLIYIDASSQAKFKLTSGSTFSGCINPGNIAGGATAATSYSNIVANAHKLYVNGTEVL